MATDATDRASVASPDVWSSGRRPTPVVTAVLALTLVNVSGNGLVMAYQLVYLHERRGIALTTAGLILGVMGLATILTTPLVGALTDRLGAARVLVAALLTGAVGYSVLGVATDVPRAIIGAVIGGASIAGAFSPVTALISALTTTATRPHAFALQRTCINLGMGLGSLLGGVIVDPDRPGSYGVLFTLDVMTFLVAAVLAWRLGRRLARHGAVNRPLARPGGSYRDVWRDRWYVLLLAYELATGLSLSLAFDILPAAVREEGIGTAWIGIMFGVNTGTVVLLQVATVSLVAGRRRIPLLAGQFVVFTAAFGLCALATAATGAARITAFVAAMVVFGAGECVLGAVRGPLVADAAPEHLIGRYAALAAMCFQAGFALGRPIGARALDHSANALWLTGVVVAVLAVPYLLRLERTAPDRLRRAAPTLR
jgi:MFS family permease